MTRHPSSYTQRVRTRVVDTSLGPVEAALTGDAGDDTILFFPGGHTTAATPVGDDLYTGLGYRVLTFSRPGYGLTDVGDLTAAEFVPAVAQVCAEFGITGAAATVGLSFGGLQAVHVAVALRHLAPRLILHSCAPSSLPYPDTALERLAVPVVFGRRTQRLTWRMVRVLTSSDNGLRTMMSTLSRLPIDEWWDRWTPSDRAAARSTFSNMDSGSGFVTDARQACAARSAYRESVLRSVPCPTLVMASREDGGVAFAHAEDFVRTIPDARLVETGASSHFFWLGDSRLAVSQAVHDFLTG
jgi:pimeloyl-ACP methyl ester carboxylesterase